MKLRIAVIVAAALGAVALGIFAFRDRSRSGDSERLPSDLRVVEYRFVVTDEESGRPIPGAVVLPEETPTDAEGSTAHLTAARTVETTALQASAYGYEPWKGRLPPLEDGDRIVRIQLRQKRSQRSFTVYAKDEFGSPVTNAILRCATRCPQTREWIQHVEGGTTDADGAVQLPVYEDYEDVEVRLSSKRVRFEAIHHINLRDLRSPYTYRGETIRDLIVNFRSGDRAEPRFDACLLFPNPEDFPAFAPQTRIAAFKYFSMPRLTLGAHCFFPNPPRMRVRVVGFGNAGAPKALEVDLRNVSETADVTLRFDPSRTVVGRLVDENGDAVEAAVVLPGTWRLNDVLQVIRFLCRIGPGEMWTYFSTGLAGHDKMRSDAERMGLGFTGPDGEFRVQALFGEEAMTVFHPRHGLTHLPLQERTVLPRRTSITGTVPEAGWISVVEDVFSGDTTLRPSPNSGLPFPVNAEGRFIVPALPAGRYLLLSGGAQSFGALVREIAGRSVELRGDEIQPLHVDFADGESPR